MAETEGKIIGYASENITSGNACYEESPLGDLIADAVCEMLQADATVVISQDIKGYLMAGDVTEEDIKNVILSDTSYFLVDLKEEELKQILEYGVSSLSLTEQETLDLDVSQTDLFPQVSGMSYRCDVSAPEGERILSFSVKEQDQYRVVVPAQLLSEEQKETAVGNYDIRTVFTQYIERQETLSVPEGGRIELLGAHNNPWISNSMFLMVVLIGTMISLVQIPIILMRETGKKERESLYLSGIFHRGN